MLIIKNGQYGDELSESEVNTIRTEQGEKRYNNYWNRHNSISEYH